jgi:hypothetical protein
MFHFYLLFHVFYPVHKGVEKAMGHSTSEDKIQEGK